MKSSVRVPTVTEILAWPVTVDVPTAGRPWALGRDEAYRRAREGSFPVPVLRLGRRMRVTRAAVLAALDIKETDGSHSATGHRPSIGDFPHVNGAASSPRSDAPPDMEAA